MTKSIEQMATEALEHYQGMGSVIPNLLKIDLVTFYRNGFSDGRTEGLRAGYLKAIEVLSKEERTEAGLFRINVSYLAAATLLESKIDEVLGK